MFFPLLLLLLYKRRSRFVDGFGSSYVIEIEICSSFPR